MSYQELDTALNKAKQCQYYKIKGEISDIVISKAESLFGHKFSKQNYEFFKRVGYLSFFGNEFFGILKEDFSGKYTGCAIESTLYDRKKYNLPNKWLTLFFFDDGFYGYLDYGQLNAEGEPPVIMAYYDGNKFVIEETVANDLGGFLLERVDNQLRKQ